MNIIQCPGPGGRNLLDVDHVETHAGYIGSSVGSAITWSSSTASKTYITPIELEVGDSYTFSFLPGASGNISAYLVNNGVLVQKETYSFSANVRKYESITATAKGTLYLQFLINSTEHMIEKGITADTSYEPYMPYKFYGDIKYPKPYLKASSSNTTKYPNTIENYDVINLGGRSWSKASGGYYYTNINPEGSYNVYHNEYPVANSGKYINHGSGRLYIGDPNIADTTEMAAKAKTMDVLIKVAAGHSWQFVKRASDNRFGYYCNATDTFHLCNAEANGTVIESDIYDHYMLKGGTT